MTFIYEMLPSRVVFEAGSFSTLTAEVKRLGCGRALLISTKGKTALAEEAAGRLGALAAGSYHGAVMHVPVEVRDEALAVTRECKADSLVAIGGGSTTGLGKIIALETGLPLIAVPTTYSGSEMTPVWGLTEMGRKRTGRDARVLPRTVIYDPDLTRTLPARIAGPSGMNAVAHCVEALYAENANPIIGLMATEGIRLMARHLPPFCADAGDAEAREGALRGAWLSGVVCGSVGMALHHKICHTLGGAFNLSHAETHTIVLPHATAYNAAAAPEAMAAISRALDDMAPAGRRYDPAGGRYNPAGGLYDLAASLGAPLALKDIGMPADGLDAAAETVAGTASYNPAPVTREGVRALLEDAFHGRRPGG